MIAYSTYRYIGAMSISLTGIPIREGIGNACNGHHIAAAAAALREVDKLIPQFIDMDTVLSLLGGAVLQKRHSKPNHNRFERAFCRQTEKVIGVSRPIIAE